jgi:hypothetical protein
MMSKKYADAVLNEEVKDDRKESKKKQQRPATATNEGAFKSPQNPSTPPRIPAGGNSSKTRSDPFNTSASSNGQPQFETMNQISPGTTSQFDSMHIDSGSGSKKKGRK